MADKYTIKTPHAAVLVWNYRDRIGVPQGGFDATGVDDPVGVEGNSNDDLSEVVPVIVSTLSCISIQTQKSKSSPAGTFNLVLAPFKNWTSNLTPGSWCCILMSNIPILEKDLKRAHRDKVKMIGRIESVRCETKVNSEGARTTQYYVSGTDWGDVFNSILYVDNLIKGPDDKGNNQGDVAAIALRDVLLSKDGAPQSFSVNKNLTAILGVMGTGNRLQEHTAKSTDTGRLAGSIYEFLLPKEVIKYFDFRNSKFEKVSSGQSLNNFIALINGKLKGPDQYADSNEAQGFIDPFSLQGTHSLWQILAENSNPALNEMFCELRWNTNNKDSGVQFALFNRIKPFSYKDFGTSSEISYKSFFQHVKTHEINSGEVMSINAGTNWRDKYNFIEIKPQFSEFAVVSNWVKQKSQVFDEKAFKREGFRSLIVDTKQFPVEPGKTIDKGNDLGIAWGQLETWAKLMREWYFGTHRMLNGTIVFHGTTPYIGVGDNIRFDTGLINPTPNINEDTANSRVHQSILAHVESISHSFSVTPDGARTYITTVQFVRGIIVDRNNKNYGEGMLDQFADKTSQSVDRNRANVFSTSDVTSDPDPQKVRGT